MLPPKLEHLRFPSGLLNSGLFLGCCILVLTAQPVAMAQPATAIAAPSSANATGKPGIQPGLADKQQLNGYAENLRPKLRRSASVQNQPYQPIQRQDEQTQIPELEMFVGESRVFPTPGVARIAVGNGQILTAAALDNKEVILFANGVGTSSLFIWSDDGRYQRVKINIVPGDTSRFAREIAAFLAAMPNTKASVIGDKVIVEGDNLTDLEIAKIDELSKRYPQIVNFTNRLGWEKTILMDVKVVEFPVTTLSEIGLAWSPAGGAAIGGIWSPFRRGNQGGLQIGIPTGAKGLPITNADGSPNRIPLPTGLNILSAINLGLNAQLNFLAQNGKASILSQPQLSARNGSKATFLAGGEYPYTVSTINGPTVIFKPFGVRLDITPRVDRTGVIRATIESEVSAIDPSINTPAGPGLSTRKTTTEFNVANGETIVLAGMITRKNSVDINKVPFLGDLPIIGALFRSKRFQNDETELVFFVTPTVVDVNSPGLVGQVARATERLQEEVGTAPYLSLPIPKGKADALDRSNAATGAASAAAARPPVLLSASAAQSINRGASLRVFVNGVSMHAAPSRASPSLVPLGRGSIVQITGADPRSVGTTTWQEVRVGDLTGWVASDWVEPFRRGDAVSRTSGVGPTAERLVRSGSLAARGVTADLPPTPNAETTAAGPALMKYRVAMNGLALRLTPDINAPIVAMLPEGLVVDALPQVPRGYWVAVQSDGQRGWVAAQWLIPEQ